MDIALVSMLFFQGFLTTNNQGAFVEVNRPVVALTAQRAAASLGAPALVKGQCAQCVAAGLVTTVITTAQGFRCEAGHEFRTVYTHDCTAPNCAFKQLTR